MSRSGEKKTRKMELEGFGEKVFVYVWLSVLRRDGHLLSPGHVSLEVMVVDVDSCTGKSAYKRGSYSENTYISFWPANSSIELENTVKKLRPQTKENFSEDLTAEERSPELIFCFHSLDTERMISRIGELRTSDVRYALFGKITFGDENVHWTKTLANTIVVQAIKLLLDLQPIFGNFGYRYLPVDLSASVTPESYSCVSMVLEVLNAGSSLSHLLGLRDKILTSAMISGDESANVSIASAKSVDEQEIKASLLQIFKSLGYLTEASVSSVIISPDIFAEFMKQAKRNEMKLYEIPDMKETFKKLDFKTEEWPTASDLQNDFRHPKRVRCAFFVCLLTVFVGFVSFLIFDFFA